MQQRILQLNEDIRCVCKFAHDETDILVSMLSDSIDELKKFTSSWATHHCSELQLRSLILLHDLISLELF